MVERRWDLREPDAALVGRLSSELGISNVLAGLLVNRGIDDPKEASEWLKPKLSQLVDPYQFHGMEAAVQLLLKHLDAGHRVTVYGDYDVDGMTASSIVARFLRSVGYAVHVFLPNRFRDGYGVNADRVGDLIDEGTRLFVTVDCGIRAVAQIAMAKERGADFIILDHHQLGSQLPNADAIVNPHQPDCSFPFDGLCAAGLAFHLAMAMRMELRRRGFFLDRPEPDLRELLDIVAIGTVADVVPLRSINRVLVSQGLQRLRQSLHPGVRSLRALAGGTRVDAGTIGYQIGPRLNACGRLSHPFKGYELLATNDPALAQGIADEIDAENQRRKDVEKACLDQALEQAVKEQGEKAPAYVLWSQDWHPGVAGIVAARIVQRFHRPCAVIAVNGDVGKGSIRSISGFDAVKGLDMAADTLIQYGGHPHAAGITVNRDSLPAFRDAFAAAAEELTPADKLTPVTRVDAELRLSDITPTLLDEIDVLGPFGRGNPAPMFMTRHVLVEQSRPVGKDQTHLKLTVSDGTQRFDAIAFGLADKRPAPGEHIDVVYRPEPNGWQGRITLQLRVTDFRPAG